MAPPLVTPSHSSVLAVLLTKDVELLRGHEKEEEEEEDGKKQKEK
jgi:hypothetical protein